MYKSSQPTQYTVVIERADVVVEVGYYGSQENADRAAETLFDTVAIIAPESFRSGAVHIWVAEPSVSYAGQF